MSLSNDEKLIREALLPVRPDDPLTGRYSEAVSALSRMSIDLREAQEREARVRGAYDELWRWVSRMPDAGFTEQSPRWNWWHQKPDKKGEDWYEGR